MNPILLLLISLGAWSLLDRLRRRHVELTNMLGRTREERREIRLEVEGLLVPYLNQRWNGTASGLQPLLVPMMGVVMGVFERHELEPSYFALQQLIAQSLDKSGRRVREESQAILESLDRLPEFLERYAAAHHESLN